MALNAGLLDRTRPIFRNPNLAAIEETLAEVHTLAREDAVGHQPVLSMLGLKMLAILAGPRNANENSTNHLVNSARMLLEPVDQRRRRTAWLQLGLPLLQSIQEISRVPTI